MRNVPRHGKSRQSVINPCLIAVRNLPLATPVEYERFRLPDDGRKWLALAHSRFEALFLLASYSNADGTFIRESKLGQTINFSLGQKVLQRRLPRASFYRRFNELRDLGLLSWIRPNHYARRIYTIHLENFHWTPEQVKVFYIEQVSDSEEQVSDSHSEASNLIPDNRSHIAK